MVDGEHIDKETFKRIFRDHWPAFKTAHPRYATAYYDEVVQKMLDCGDPEKMGFVQYLCPDCGASRCIGFSCKSCFCLSCARPYMDRWVDFIGRRLLPGVVYRHIVLTVPEMLRLEFYRRPELLSPLMRTGQACLQDVLSLSAGTPLDTGSVIVLQTAGRAGNYNPHLHTLETAGGLDPQGNWVPLSYIPYDLLHRKWQHHLLTMLRRLCPDSNTQRLVDQAWQRYPNGFVAHVQPGDVPPGAQGLATYLAKYVVSPPIAVRRIENYDGRSVSYWYRDHRTKNVQHLTLPALTFLGRMAQHILPKGFQRIRYYGLHGNVRYARMRQRLAAILPANAPPDPRGFRVKPRKPFVQLFLHTFARNPLLCPTCHQPMSIALIKHPTYGIIKNYYNDLFTEPTDAQPAGPASIGQPRPMDRAQRLVLLSLPFM